MYYFSDLDLHHLPLVKILGQGFIWTVRTMYDHR
jgi:hypothetical protein